ncbi:YihY/virulence factor BrkB family protein [Salicibibacter kimchii]|uniref:YihY/virulence factor BrkB family protein n=1 Tax=Salicibibacter kimchii TaxID=2099786 RepID=A0A345C343_9BACI|nr:YihY/virulence factor BrkB family protein [Salicibibacter kimchii]AXF57624.1 YihY/virulence factor BrkB family protein [Salicibibacter kimchii]
MAKAIVKRMIQSTWEYRLFDIAAQMAYYFLLALFPLLIVLLSILHFLPVGVQDVLELIHPYVPNHLLSFIAANLSDVLNVNRAETLSISTLVTIWMTLMGAFAVIRAVNSAYRFPDPSLSRMILVGFVLVFTLLTAVIVSLLFPVFGEPIGRFVFTILGLEETMHIFWSFIRWGISFLVVGVVLLILYMIVPSQHMSWRDTWPGALFAAVGWQTASLGFSYFNQWNDYTIIYGGLGTIIGLMIWFFLTALMILLGAQLNAVMMDMHRES